MIIKFTTQLNKSRTTAWFKKRIDWQRWTLILGAHIAVLILWEIAVKLFAIQAFILPAPTAVFGSLSNPNYQWIENTMVTAIEVFVGYAVGVIAGIFFAIAFVSSRRLTTFLFPVLISLNMIPKVALGPLIIVWFGIGIIPNTIVTISLVIFPVILTAIRGLTEVEPDLLSLVQVLKGSRWQIFRYIQLPGSLPYIFSGMKVATVLAVAGAVVGEFIASRRGLGYLMLQAQASLDTAAVFMAVLLLSGLGVLLYITVLLLEIYLIPEDSRVK